LSSKDYFLPLCDLNNNFTHCSFVAGCPAHISFAKVLHQRIIFGSNSQSTANRRFFLAVTPRPEGFLGRIERHTRGTYHAHATRGH
jgi:hypothetical protein